MSTNLTLKRTTWHHLTSCPPQSKIAESKRPKNRNDCEIKQELEWMLKSQLFGKPIREIGNHKSCKHLYNDIEKKNKSKGITLRHKHLGGNLINIMFSQYKLKPEIRNLALRNEQYVEHKERDQLENSLEVFASILYFVSIEWEMTTSQKGRLLDQFYVFPLRHKTVRIITCTYIACAPNSSYWETNAIIQVSRGNQLHTIIEVC